MTVLRTNDGYAYTAPVRTYSANGFGLYDMLGNVRECCEDWYEAYPGSPKRRGVTRYATAGTDFSGGTSRVPCGTSDLAV